MEYVLRTNDLTKTYEKTNVVNKVSLNVAKGDIYGFIGKNGAGKTSLMKMVCGLTTPNNGEIELFESRDLNKGRKRMGSLIEQPAIYLDMSARENLIYYNKILGIPDDSNVDELLEKVGLADVGKKKAKKFSLGMKQRLSIAIALIGSPDLLILDEPINGLDPAGIKEIRELLRSLNEEENITILISSHILGELSKLATRYGIINNGNLADEFTEEELNKRCKKCIKVEVDDIKKASYVVNEIIGSKDYKVFDNNVICIYDCLQNQGNINSELIKNGVMVNSITMWGEDLEVYFMEMIERGN